MAQIDLTCGREECGHKGTYEVVGRCLNCSATFTLVISRGHEKPGGYSGAKCPTCGCRRVKGYGLVDTDKTGMKTSGTWSL